MATDEVPGPVDAAKLVSMYVKARDKVEEIDKAAKANKKPFEDAMAKIEVILLGQLAKQNADSVATSNGTFFKSKKVSVTVGDKDSFIAWIRSDLDTRLDYADLRAAKTNIVSFKDANNGALPDGIAYREEVTVQVRRKS